MEGKGIDYLRTKLNNHKVRVDMRYEHYAMKKHDYTKGITIPESLKREYKAVLGWCAKGVDSLADRLIFREFANDDFEVKEIFEENNPDIFFDSVVLSALIASCSFVYISQGEDDNVRLQVIEASNATGIIDPISGLLTEGYAVLNRDENGSPSLEAHFLPEKTVYYTDKNKPDEIDHDAGVPLLVPVIHRPDAVRPFGRSRITRSGIYHQSYAKRTLERADVTAEFYSFPQKYVTGTDRDLEKDPLDSWKATISAMLEFTASEDVGYEVCRSTGDEAAFLQAEQNTFKQIAEDMLFWGMKPNRSTVRLHKEFSATACPHRSWELHGKTTDAVKDYFINQINKYMTGGSSTNSNNDTQNKTTKLEDLNMECIIQKGKSQYYYDGTSIKALANPNETLAIGTVYKAINNKNITVVIVTDAEFESLKNLSKRKAL